MEFDALRGRIVDFDSHLMLFPDVLDDILGPSYANRPIRRMVTGQGVNPSEPGNILDQTRKRARGDVWGVKGWGAHGAQVAGDRLDALDQMGIGTQLVFSVGMVPAMYGPDAEAASAITRYNDYVLDWTGGSNGRLAPVCLLNAQSVEVAMTEARRVVDQGARFVQLPHGAPLAGLSPADRRWDDLWALLADAGVPATFHGGTHAAEMQIISPEWRAIAATLRPPSGDAQDGNVHAFPIIWTTAHLPAEVALTFMVLGGVFERHPRLRFGVIELGASWVAPWCARLDTLATAPCTYLTRQLAEPPSHYVRRQLRFTPFVFEPVGDWIRRDGLDEVYVFSTDYPHVEGGDDPVGRFLRALDHVDASAVERFFVGNAAELVVA